MEQITFQIKNSKELHLLISIAEKLGIKKYTYSNSLVQKQSELQNIYKIIDAGADISTFGEITQWQRTTRADREVNFNRL